MPATFTDDQLAFARAVREFCRREVPDRETLLKLTDNGREAHNQQVYDKLAATGYLGVSMPEELGGSGGGIVEQVLLFEELCYAVAPVHGAGCTHTVAGVYKRFAGKDQARRAIEAICAGAVYSISISEPEAGSDAANIGCRAERVDGGYVINGQKTWCTDAQFASRILLVARTSRGDSPHFGLTMFDVPADAEGLDISPISTMGGSEVNDLYFADVFVPDSAIVGQVDHGWPQLMAGLNGERLVCAAQGLGMAQRTLDDLVAYLKQREQFGQPIGTFQALRHRVADLAVAIQSARALTYQTAFRVDAEPPSKELASLTSMAKIASTETAKKVALEGVQMMGGYGYATEFGMEAHLRRAIAPTIYAGTNEIQREIIANGMGLRGN